MTTDAKVGLLLGLVFIVIIAFLINGLPDFLKPSEARGLIQVSAEDIDNRSLIIGSQAQRAVEDVTESVPLRVSEPPREEEVIHNFSVQAEEAIAEIRNQQSITNTGSSVRTYVVQSGDSLGTIAPKIYGPELGNKRATIEKIYLVNKKNLESPDKIIPGQKLIIPQLSSVQGRVPDESLFPEGVFERVKNAFSRKGDKPGETKKTKVQNYVVKDGDSLWKIAEKCLGDGDRFKEIEALNSDELENSDDLSVGMRLKLPGI
jgi:nucleoid-associated protein YgaU